jgi:PAS domain S-box-containing protein
MSDPLLAAEKAARASPEAAPEPQLRLDAAASPQSESAPFHFPFDTAQIGIYRATTSGVVIVGNGPFFSMLGLNPGEPLDPFPWEKVNAVMDPPRSLVQEHLEREGELTGLESTWRRADGTVIRVREHVRPVRNPDGTVAYYMGTVEDITPRCESDTPIIVACSSNV